MLWYLHNIYIYNIDVVNIYLILMLQVQIKSWYDAMIS